MRAFPIFKLAILIYLKNWFVFLKYCKKNVNLKNITASIHKTRRHLKASV